MDFSMGDIGKQEVSVLEKKNRRIIFQFKTVLV